MLAGRDVVGGHITHKQTNGIIIHLLSVILYLILNTTGHINSISDLSLNTPTKRMNA